MNDMNQAPGQKRQEGILEKTTDTLVVGAGQAGVAMSEHLSTHGVPHLVLESNRIAEAWRTCRWDSLVANGPAWHDRFPGLEFDNDPDEFVPKERVADYLEAYASKISAPIRTGIEVKKVLRNTDSSGFTVDTSAGVIQAERVVVATGPFQRSVIPTIAPQDDKLTQIHSAKYRNPEQLPDGAVLVVGAGSSEWDAEAPKAGREHVTIAVSGTRGGHTVDFRKLAQQGITLVGMTNDFQDGAATFLPDLADNMAQGDENYLSLLDAADDYVARNSLDLPEEPEARNFLPDPEC
jgi:putative flavoprotein involved in K+ transport